MKVHYWETRTSMTPQKAFEFLKEGNKRFVNNLRYNHDHLEVINETKDQQFPFACILSCSDSRISTELAFDQGLGDLFSIRLAGNIPSISAIGSMEYSCKVLGSRLIVVMGHTNCGAVRGACDGFKMGNLDEIMDIIGESVDTEKETVNDRVAGNKKFVNNVARLNVENGIKTTLRKSSIISELVNAGEVGIIGAIYDVETGHVEFLSSNISKNLTYAAANTN
jgi:carbonic anhydrase